MRSDEMYIKIEEYSFNVKTGKGEIERTIKRYISPEMFSDMLKSERLYNKVRKVKNTYRITNNGWLESVITILE